jgi:GntR family transcriptional regulator, transcriptional repressor for pyruvate dehydrogenase complex
MENYRKSHVPENNKLTIGNKEYTFHGMRKFLQEKIPLTDLRLKRRDTLVNLVAEDIRAWILDGGIKTDDSLPSQGELSRIFSVSVTVIREALKKLQSQGLIDVSQGKRPSVKKIGTKAAMNVLDAWIHQGHGTIQDLYEVRTILEGEIAAIASRKATDNDIKELEKIIGKFSTANTLHERVEVDFTFHRLLAEISRNPVFVLLIDALRGLFIEYQEYSYFKVGLPNSFYHPHLSVYNAIKNHDVDSARKAMIEHLEIV